MVTLEGDLHTADGVDVEAFTGKEGGGEGVKQGKQNEAKLSRMDGGQEFDVLSPVLSNTADNSNSLPPNTENDLQDSPHPHSGQNHNI